MNGISRSDFEFLSAGGGTGGGGKPEAILRGSMTDMDMFKFAYNLAEQNLIKEPLGWSEAAYQTVLEMRKKYEGQWHAIVVSKPDSIGYYIRTIPGYYVEFKVGRYVFLIWKSA